MYNSVASDIQFAPVPNWRDQCERIAKWLTANRRWDNAYELTRRRPPGALLLYGMLESYWEYGQREFWRIEGDVCVEFEFDGVVLPVSDTIPYPVYGEVGNENYRSIEDANLIPNTYTNTYVFGSEEAAMRGMEFLHRASSPVIAVFCE